MQDIKWVKGSTGIGQRDNDLAFIDNAGILVKMEG